MFQVGDRRVLNADLNRVREPPKINCDFSIPPVSLQVVTQEPSKSSREWNHFVVSLLTIGPLAVTTVWRSFMTTGPIKDRRYFFPNTTWIGWIDHHWLRDSLNRIDHNWFNDFILGPGTVSCFYLAFTGLYAIAGLASSHESATHASNHKRRLKIILYVILGRALFSGWAEEVQLVPSPFIFDVKDVVIEGAGVVLAYW